MAALICVVCKVDLSDAQSFRQNRDTEQSICNRCWRYRGRNRRLKDHQLSNDAEMVTIADRPIISESEKAPVTEDQEWQ